MDRAEVSVDAPIDSNGAGRNFCGRRSYTRMGQSSGSVLTEPSVDGADAAMERYSMGDDAAFAELYDAIAPRLLGFLRKATRDDAAAEDLMQQTLLHIHRERGTFIPGAAVTPWAYAIARRLMIDGARRRRLERRLFADAPDGDDAAYEPAQSTAGAEELLHARRVEGRVREQLEDLPESQRTAYRLLQQEGLSLKAAAEVLGVSVTAVKLRAHRAYVALRAVLREAGEAR
jgi:RNA polymerase sigma-70 factor, ECF subfamily